MSPEDFCQKNKLPKSQNQKSGLLALGVSTGIRFQDGSFLKTAIGDGNKLREGERKKTRSQRCAGTNVANSSLRGVLQFSSVV